MATFTRFEDIDAWQKARTLVKAVYEVTSQPPFAKDFGLRDQVRRSGVSIMANIAEGFERGGNREFLQFLGIAKGSVGELRSHLYVALDQGYITQQVFNQFHTELRNLASVIGGLMNYLRGSSLKGAKFNVTRNVERGTRNASR